MSEKLQSSGGGAGLHVQIDHESCSGSGYCIRLCPDVFELKDEKSCIRENVNWSSVDREILNQACNACPWVAIKVEGA